MSIQYTFAVVMRVGPETLAHEFIVPYQRENDPAKYRIARDDDEAETSIVIKIPVFEVGEILILDDSGREPGYPGRKPSKWDVDFETFSDVQSAAKRADELCRY